MNNAPAVTLERLERARLVPVVVIDDARQALAVARALADGGIRCAEITLRTSAGIPAIAAIAQLDDFTVGAGTVLTLADVDACADAGAEFIVSPGLDPAVVERSQALPILALPGIATASELQGAQRLGLRAVKFFPADRLGGLGTIAALAAPFPGMRFMPSGGVGVDNLVEYLSHPSIFAAGGSWMVPRAIIAAGDFAAITRLAAHATSLIESIPATLRQPV
ncbi:bifunctional 4-hydroxy-2-oxoglutarate aldolase/2-dehydro-3-deoxy-phosphogluconate aldolase [Lacisediminihabitans sp. FW035]